MTNEDRKRFLLRRAEDEYAQIASYQKKGEWNMVIRKSQEATEFYLKAILKLMNVEFPREHDIGKYFVDILAQKGIAIDPGKGEKIKALSAGLADKRAPAYYGDVFYTEDEATTASAGARELRDIARELLARLGGGEKGDRRGTDGKAAKGV